MLAPGLLVPAMRRILVTGAEGFVGGHLVPALRAAFPGVVLLTERFDVTDPVATRRALAERPDGVVHLAAIAAPAEARDAPDVAWAVNRDGALLLGRLMREMVPEAVLVFAGSAEAYGEAFRAGVALDEGAPLEPVTVYAQTKAAADVGLGALAAEGLRVVRVRPFNHTGPGQSEAYVVPAFARQAARIAAGVQSPVFEVGALGAEKDFLDVRDVCAAYVRCLQVPLAPGAVVNVASGVGRRIGDVLSEVAALAGVVAEVRTSAARLRANEIARTVGDAGFARRVLGWAPVVPWEQTLADVLAEWRARVRH